MQIDANISIILSTGQDIAAVLPVFPGLFDPTQGRLHAAVDEALYCPATHSTHVVAPAAPSVLVTEPGGQTAHELR